MRHQNDIPIDLSQRVTRFIQHAYRAQTSRSVDSEVGVLARPGSGSEFSGQTKPKTMEVFVIWVYNGYITNKPWKSYEIIWNPIVIGWKVSPETMVSTMKGVSCRFSLESIQSLMKVKVKKKCNVVEWKQCHKTIQAFTIFIGGIFTIKSGVVYDIVLPSKKFDFLSERWRFSDCCPSRWRRSFSGPALISWGFHGF